MADGTEEERAGPDGDRLRRLRYLDFTLGAWRPREAAHQLAITLGVELPPQTITPTGLASIDSEGDSDPIVATAFEDAARLGRMLPTGAVVAVLAPRYGMRLRPENEWFFLFLRRIGVSVTIIGDDPPVSALTAAPFERRRGITSPTFGIRSITLTEAQSCLLRFFPGLLPGTVAAEVGLDPIAAGLLPAGSGHYLIPIESRDRDPREGARDVDALGAVEKADPAFRNFGRIYCTNYFADSGEIASLGRSIFLAGSADLGATLLDRARSLARDPTAAAKADLYRREILLFDRRHTEIARETEPSRRAPAALREKLSRLKALSAAMAGSPHGDTPADQTRAKVAGARTPDELYMLTREAVAAGDQTTADEVAAALPDDADQRLVFAAALARAQILIRRREYATASTELARAFATSAGGRSLGEIVEMNALMAAANESEEARMPLLRAALAWLVIEPAEGLSRRVARAVTGTDSTARTQLDGAVSGALAAALVKSWPGLTPAALVRLPKFRRAGSLRARKLFGAPGVSVLWTTEMGVSPVYHPTRGELVRLVMAALIKLVPRSAEAEGGNILVDTNLGIDIPVTRAEALSVALRHGVAEFAFGSEFLNLDAGTLRQLLADLKVGYSPLVLRIEEDGSEALVTFKRNLPPARLDSVDWALVSPLRDGSHIPLDALAAAVRQPLDAIQASIARLETQRVLRVDWMGKAPEAPASLEENSDPVGTPGGIDNGQGDEAWSVGLPGL